MKYYNVTRLTNYSYQVPWAPYSKGCGKCRHAGINSMNAVVSGRLVMFLRFASVFFLGEIGGSLPSKRNGPRWWFHFFLCSPLFGEDFQFDFYFSDGLKPPTRDFKTLSTSFFKVTKIDSPNTSGHVFSPEKVTRSRLEEPGACILYGLDMWKMPVFLHLDMIIASGLCKTRWWFQISFGIFTPNLGVSWSKLTTAAYVSKGLVGEKPPTRRPLCWTCHRLRVSSLWNVFLLGCGDALVFQKWSSHTLGLEIFGHPEHLFSRCLRVLIPILTRYDWKTRDDLGFAFFRCFFTDLIPWYITIFRHHLGKMYFCSNHQKSKSAWFCFIVFFPWYSSPVSCWKTIGNVFEQSWEFKEANQKKAPLNATLSHSQNSRPLPTNCRILKQGGCSRGGCNWGNFKDS